jgi:hypothetical protein
LGEMMAALGERLSEPVHATADDESLENVPH